MEAALAASSDQLRAIGRESSSGEIEAVRKPGELPTAEVLVGREVAGYVVGRRLGGERSSVFHARAPNRDEVALKVLPREKIDRNPITAKRFLREARALSGITHPNLIRMFDAGEELGSYYLAMELHKGWDLEEELSSSGGKLPEADAVSIAVDVARGLEHLHAQGLVHRAVRPKHILLKTTKLCGFGLLRVVGPGTEAHDVTQKGQVIGKPDYMSPEQVRGQDLDGRSDLFSLGVTLYQALTGALPFRGESPMQLVMAILRTNPPPVHERAPGVSAAISRVVERLMAKDPDGRYATAKQLLTDLGLG